MKPLDTGQAVGAREGIRASPPATAIQRRYGLYLSVIAPTLVEKAAAGEHVTVREYKGDFLANSNKGARTSKHNGVLRAAQNAIRARSVGSIILGDKEKPEVTRHLNDTSRD